MSSINDSLENKNSVSQITYFVEFILVATILLTSFSSCISLVKDTVQSLVGFTNSLLPILITLML